VDEQGETMGELIVVSKDAPLQLRYKRSDPEIFDQCLADAILYRTVF